MMTNVSQDQGTVGAAEQREASSRAQSRTGDIDGRVEGAVDNIVRGWVWKPEGPQERVAVRVFVDGADIGGAIANVQRDDLARAGIGDGSYGFRLPLPASILTAPRHHLRVEADGRCSLPPAAGFSSLASDAAAGTSFIVDVTQPPGSTRAASGSTAPIGKRRSAQQFRELPEDQVAKFTEYVVRRCGGLDASLLPYGDPAGKDVLVFGCGYGADTLWAVQRKARSILATDVSPGLSPVPFERALDRLGLTFDDYEFRRESIYETAITGEKFDLIISRDVFEHIHDLKGTLASFRSLLRPAGRIAIYADSFWFSSVGGHLHLPPWAHLYRCPADLKQSLPQDRWDVYCNRLNRMTLSDFVEAIRTVGLIVLQMSVVPDPNLRDLPALLAKIRQQFNVSPTDLSIMSVGCELCFEENL